jgi:hypothetical protein
VTFHENSLKEMESLCALHNETLSVIGTLQEAKEICVEVM